MSESKITIVVETSETHYSLFSAAEEGDYQAFMKAAPRATQNDLEWAADVASNTHIVKYLHQNLTDKHWLSNAYLKAIRNNNIPVMHYLEKHLTEICLNKLNKRISEYDKYRPVLSEMYNTHKKMLPCRNRKRNSLRKFYAKLQDKQKFLKEILKKQTA
jgi:hypothetical protein